LNVTNSTFSDNSAPALQFNGDSGAGGAIVNWSQNGTVNVTNSTFSGNRAGSGSSIASVGSSPGDIATKVRLTNSIVADGTGNGCDEHSVWIDGGGNLADDGSCGGTQVTNADLNLGALADNGGPTQTIALGPGSAAINAATCLQA